ncbi:MAG TPA: hypothetical protein VF721_22755 [Pyrinomonadaceae bacterium]|jgi:hypothetical protein
MLSGIGFIVLGAILALGIFFFFLYPVIQSPKSPSGTEEVKGKVPRIILSIVGIVFGIGFIVAGIWNLTRG